MRRLVTAVFAAALLTGAPAEAQISGFGWAPEGLTVALDLPPVSGALYCFFWSGVTGTTRVNGGNPGVFCAFDFQAQAPGRLVASISPAPGTTVGPTVCAQATRNSVFYAQACDSVPPPPPPPPPDPTRSLRVRAALFDDVTAPSAGRAVPATARVPLGAVVTFEAIDNHGAQVPASFSLGSATLQGTVDINALFAGVALHAYAADTAHLRRFQAAHLGTVTVTVTPSDATLAPGAIAVTVEAPSSLGNEGTELDADIVTTANRTGIPPHFIKAHVWKESFPKWNRFTYRYEPIGPAPNGDLEGFYEGGRRTLVPFSNYRLATQADTRIAALAEGALLLNADRDPRATLRIGCDANGQNGVPIGAGATPVNPTAWEIFRCNDKTGSRMNWSVAAGKFAPARIERLKNSPFTAQTPLAASYGLLQVTTSVAYEDVGWSASDGSRNPSLLFDSAAAIARDGGSLLVGSHKMTNLTRQVARRTRLSLLPTSIGELYSLFIRAWRLYNSGEPDYSQAIFFRVGLHAPAGRADGVLLQ